MFGQKICCGLTIQSNGDSGISRFVCEFGGLAPDKAAERYDSRTVINARLELLMVAMVWGLSAQVIGDGSG